MSKETPHQEKTAAKTLEEEVHQVGLIATPLDLLVTSVAEVKSVRQARV